MEAHFFSFFCSFKFFLIKQMLCGKRLPSNSLRAMHYIFFLLKICNSLDWLFHLKIYSEYAQKQPAKVYLEIIWSRSNPIFNIMDDDFQMIFIVRSWRFHSHSLMEIEYACGVFLSQMMMRVRSGAAAPICAVPICSLTAATAAQAKRSAWRSK